jgi:hypothetical protein
LHSFDFVSVASFIVVAIRLAPFVELDFDLWFFGGDLWFFSGGLWSFGGDKWIGGDEWCEKGDTQGDW